MKEVSREGKGENNRTKKGKPNERIRWLIKDITTHFYTVITKYLFSSN